ncbi:hypothetical protein TNCT_666521, partial [Trichonephila clavata]
QRHSDASADAPRVTVPATSHRQHQKVL